MEQVPKKKARKALKKWKIFGKFMYTFPNEDWNYRFSGQPFSLRRKSCIFISVPSLFLLNYGMILLFPGLGW